MRFYTLLLIALCFGLASCGGFPTVPPDLRTVTYSGSDWEADDIVVAITPAPAGWRVDVTSVAAEPAETLLLELHFDKSLVATGAQSSCPEGELSLLAFGRPGGIGLGVIMQEGASITPGALMSFTLTAAGHAVSLAPNASYIPDLSGIGSVGQVDLEWNHHLSGDYDQNGFITIGDISALGPRLGHSTTDSQDDARDELVDGDANGLITVADLTPIGAGLLSELSAYSIYSANGPDLASATVVPCGEVLFSDATPPNVRKHFAFSITDPDRIADEYFYVRPIIDGADKTPSNVVHVTPVAPVNFLFEVPPPDETTIDNAFSRSPSLALLPGNGTDIEDGAPLVVYISVGGGELRFAFYRDNAWQTSPVIAGVFMQPKLYIDGSDWYVIAYDATLSKVVRMRFDSTLTM
ncbi:MAG: hypothetical protein M3R04_04820, partial [bacterium]|nr:hypothetical protein [bacterium]